MVEFNNASLNLDTDTGEYFIGVDFSYKDTDKTIRFELRHECKKCHKMHRLYLDAMECCK